MRIVLAFGLRLLAALIVLYLIIGMRQNLGPLETATLLIAAVALVVGSLRVGRWAIR
jgi:hypothetical protein